MKATEIRFASEKQVNLINKLATKEQYGYEPATFGRCAFKYSAGIVCSELEGLNNNLLTMSAASDIISESLSYVRYLGRYNKYLCDAMTAKFTAYSIMLKQGFEYVPECMFTATNNEDEYEAKFKYECFMVTIIIRNNEVTTLFAEKQNIVNAEDCDIDVDAINAELNTYKTMDVFDSECNEDWYREGSGQYYEDKAEMLCGVE